MISTLLDQDIVNYKKRSVAFSDALVLRSGYKSVFDMIDLKN